MTPKNRPPSSAKYLGPAFRDAHLRTKIMIFDHNWDLIDFPDRISSDPKAAEFSAGIDYTLLRRRPGSPDQLHDHFPAKDIWLTNVQAANGKKAIASWLKQASSSKNHSQTGRRASFSGISRSIKTTDPFRRRTKLPRRSHHRPLHIASDGRSTGGLHRSRRTQQVCRAGAFSRRFSSSEQSSLEHVAFRNSDGSIVLLVLIPSATPISFSIAWQGECDLHAPAQHVVPSAGP